MKSTGIVRRLDSLGRIVVPIELRKTLGIVIKDPLEIFVDADMIILRKYIRGCVKCGVMENLINADGDDYCPDCAKKMALALKRGMDHG